MTREQIGAWVSKYESLILDAQRYIWKHPETGYKEVKTSAYLKDRFEQLGYQLTVAQGIPGFYTRIETGREGPEILILAELDSIICPQHKDADAQTGAVHSCGHNAQCAALLGIAAALKEPDALRGLCGAIRLCAVPAEELLEIEYRSKLKEQGIIRYYGGKTEFLARGYFDGVDLAFMVHTANRFFVQGGSVGCIAKRIIYKGVSAHAGGSPWDGRNALYAASLGLQSVNAIRETFRESDLIRVHPIMTHGGDMVNAIPERAVLESYVRGSSFDAIERANVNVNRAFVGAALSIGTNVEIIDYPGYAPLINDKGLVDIAREAYSFIAPGNELTVSDNIGTGSTDLGDLSCLMPVVHPYAAGARGKGHGSDYEIENPMDACVESAKWQLAMVALLLENEGERAKKIIREYQPQFATKEAYFAYLEKTFSTSGDRIQYNDDTTAFVR